MMQDNPNSQFNTFSDSYNRGFYEYANNISGSFFKSIDVDKNILINQADDSVLKAKFENLDTLIKGQDSLDKKDYYGLVKLTGRILADVVIDIMQSKKPEVKKSGVNIINAFFDVARKTKDNELLDTAQSIKKNVDAITAK
ncbi:MAG: hypothetical protein Q8941_04875 [Bacteroidota bacterium]|nr:hypothetical protein [Bacteroidota bacterium]